MRIFHTADWHIGKIINEFSMIEDQIYILKKLYKLMEEEKPDVLVIAGDIYDRSIAPVEAIEALDEFLDNVINKLKIKVLAISGNHDSSERIEFGKNIFEKQGLYMEGTFNGEVRKVTLNDEFGNVNFYLLPYVHPALVKRKYDDITIKNYNDAMKVIIDKINNSFNEEERNVLVTHGYITMRREEVFNSEEDDKHKLTELEESDSERPLSIGGTELIDGALFNKFNYTALGHLHGQQKVGSNKIRYSGSLLKYSFSEVNHKKGIDIVDLDRNGDVEVNHVELEPKRDMRVIRGTLQDLINAAREDLAGREDYIEATILDKGEIIDPMQKLREVYPNVMLIKRGKDQGDLAENEVAITKIENKSHIELFGEYYSSVWGEDFTEEKYGVVNEIINDLLKGDD